MNRKLTFIPVLAVVLAAALVPVSATEAGIIKGPYLQQVTPDSIVIMWETDSAADSRVDYDDGVSDPAYVYVDESVTIHEVPVTGLAADTVYQYTVTSGTATSEPSIFATAPATPRSFRFVAYGDTRTNPDLHADVVQGIINSEPEFVLHSGDLVNDGRIQSSWETEFFTPARDLMLYTPMYPVLGNHEYNASWYYDFFSLPNNEQWYAFTYGNVRFIGLNTCTTYSTGNAQYIWLVAELQSTEYSDATWHIVYFHHPPYSSGSHGGDTGVQTHLVPLFEAYGVDMVFNGHDHIYERSFKNNVYYIVTGGGGAPLRDINVTSNPYQQYAESTLHHCVIDVTGETLSLSARYNNGTEFDGITITKTSQASNPNPTNEATGVDINADLSWTAGSGATMHQIYFAGDPVVEQPLGNETYDPGELVPGTAYSWRIDEVAPGGTTTGDVWSFTTAAPPSQVTGESPGDGVSNVDITTDLNWTAATGAASYDVYFGDTYPLASIGNQAATTYDPGTLDPDTIYYWQIDSVSPGGTTTGAVWSFTTATAPSQASDPQPPDGTLAVLLDTDLGWTAGSDTTSHDVYFGVEPETLVLVSPGQTGTTFEPGTLDSGTTYYWVVDEIGPGGVTPGPIWTFTTVALPWTDGFESGDLATGGWVTSGLVQVRDDAATGIYAVRTNRAASLEKATSTAGFGSITVSFAAKTFGMDDGESLYVEWFNGSGWNPAGTIDRNILVWTSQSLECLGAEDNSSFIIRFRSNADKNREYVYIDDVQINGIPLGPDETPPTPNPMTWATVPYATGENSIAMAATIASDPSGVEYYFTNVTVTGNDSGWQDSPSYEDTGLARETTYTYTVTARDKSANLNETGASDPASATTDAVDTTAPAPDPMTWATVPYATGSTSVSMTAMTASDPSGVEYYFACIAGGGNDSGWQDSATYEDTGLSPNTEYTYTVQARDKSPSQNLTDASSAGSATTPDTPVTDVVTIVRADYRIRQGVFTVQATSSQGGVAVLTVVGYGTMTYTAEENLYTLRQTVADAPGDTVTVESDLGGSDTGPVTHK